MYFSELSGTAEGELVYCIALYILSGTAVGEELV
jgi:hypothetical protein